MTELVWKSRCRRETNLVAHRRIWESRCGRYRVVHWRSLFGLPDVFYAMRRMAPASWAILRRHRERRPAMQTCERDCQCAVSTT